MIFSIIMALTGGLTVDIAKLSILHPTFLLGHDGWSGDLLVHRRIDAGRHHGRVPRGGVHQAQHQCSA